MENKRVIVKQPFLGIEAGIELEFNPTSGKYEYNNEHIDISDKYETTDKISISVSPSTIENNIGTIFTWSPEFLDKAGKKLDDLIIEGERDFEQLLSVHKELIQAMNDLSNELAELRRQRSLVGEETKQKQV